MSKQTKTPTTAERIDDLMALHPKGYDLSLGRITELLEKLGNPQNNLPAVMHFAGTNGKGSTIAFTRSILEAAGLSVHVHTSPHLVNWNERYRLGQKQGLGKLVDDAILSDAIARVAKANAGNAITVFEILTAAMFLLFHEHPADVCLVEVGLGGRFDASNVMQDVDVSIITPVSIDHEAFLGNTLAKIAFEKAGIIKRKTNLVVGIQEDEALAVIETVAAKNLAPTVIAQQHYHASEENGRLIYQDEDSLLDLALPLLPGKHQIQNVATAIAACKSFCGIHNRALDPEQIDAGIQNASWPGRLQHLTKGELLKYLSPNTDIWIDGGHNPSAALAVVEVLKTMARRDPRPVIMVCGMLDTKDTSGYLTPFAEHIKQMITVPIISSEAGVPADQLAQQAKNAGIETRPSSSLIEALESINEPEPYRLLVAGSLYLVGDVLAQNKTIPI